MLYRPGGESRNSLKGGWGSGSTKRQVRTYRHFQTDKQKSGGGGLTPLNPPRSTTVIGL